MIPHNRPTLGLEEHAAANRVLNSGWVAQGAEVEGFENEICEFLGLPHGHAVAVSSGSAALYLALWVLDGANKKIGLPVYSCGALKNAIGLINGQPSYLDCAVDSPNLDIGLAGQSGLDILIAPSMFGFPIKVDAKRSYELVEDLAQAFGAKIDGVPIGVRGEVGICSFYTTKLITSGGQGGAVVSKDKSLIDAVRDYREFDCRTDGKLRFNFQMTDLQAAIGRVQLNRIQEFIIKRQNIFDEYTRAGVNLVNEGNGVSQPVRYRAIVRSQEPDNLITALNNQQIKAIIPIERSELLDEPLNYPNANKFSTSTVSLPVYPSLNLQEISLISKVLAKNL